MNVSFGNSMSTITDKKTPQTKKTNPYNEHTSILHSKQGYKLMKNTAWAAMGSLGAFALLQTIDNRSLKTKNKPFFKILPKTLKFVLTLAAGIGAVYLSKYTDKFTDKAVENIAQAHSRCLDFEIKKSEGNI